jgi:hypothetical protein
MWYSFHKHLVRIYVVSANYLKYKETKKHLILHNFCIKSIIIFQLFKKLNFDVFSSIDFRRLPSKMSPGNSGDDPN